MGIVWLSICCEVMLMIHVHNMHHIGIVLVLYTSTSHGYGTGVCVGYWRIGLHRHGIGGVVVLRWAVVVLYILFASSVTAIVYVFRSVLHVYNDKNVWLVR